MIVELIVIALALSAAAVIHWKEILAFLRPHKLSHDDVAVLLRGRIAHGKRVRIRANIFKDAPNASPHHQQTWEGDALDEQLDQLFGNDDYVEVEL